MTNTWQQTAFGPYVEPRPVAQEELDDVKAAEERSEVESSFAFVVGFVPLAALLQQVFHDIRAAEQSSRHQGRGTVFIINVLVHPVLNQASNHCEITFVNGRV